MSGLTYLSLGAGVQSTALLAMSALGLYNCPRADVAIFADTQDEPQWVYEHLSELEVWSPIPIRRVTYGCLSDDIRRGRRKTRKGVSAIPAYTIDYKHKGSLEVTSEGHLRRHCSTDYKLTPIAQEARRLIGRKRGARATALIGISIDEAHRMKDAAHGWMTNRYPLVEARITREECEAIASSVGLPVPKKSACIFCPYHSNAYWRMLRNEEPDSWERAVEFDRFVRRGLPGVTGTAFLHSDRLPLYLVDLNRDQAEMFGNECEGMCGV